MKNNKGFTLIELLAVMVILAIIALIAVPAVMSVINNARKASAVNSTYGIIKAAEAYYANELLVNGGTFSNADTDIDVAGSTIEYKGTKAVGKIQISADGKVTFSASNSPANTLKVNGFNCTLSGDTVSCSN